MLYVKNFIVPRGETNAYADEEKIIERNVPNAKKWRERERERRQSEKGKHGRKRRMEEGCISLVPCGRRIFWVDSCQLRAVSTEDYSLTYRAAPLYALSAVCVYFFPRVFIFFPLSFFLFFLQNSLLIFRGVKSSNFLTNGNSRIFHSCLAISTWWLSRLPSMIEFLSTIRNRLRKHDILRLSIKWACTFYRN